MNRNEVKKGRIVVITNIENGVITMGNPQGSIVKILSKPGEISDEVFKVIGISTHRIQRNRVLCERAKTLNFFNVHYNNIPAFYEDIDSLKLATIDEKKAYSKGISHTSGVKYTSDKDEEVTDVDF